MLMRSPTVKRRRQRGLSIVELMVGVVIGLFIVGGAAKWFVDNLLTNRRALLETRVNQEMRAVADLIARDLRRAGYWRNAMASVGTPPVINPYGGATWGGTSVAYSYDHDGDDATLTASEQAGFVLNGTWIETNAGQRLTDPDTIKVTAFSLPANAAAATQWIELGYACQCLSTGTCTVATLAADPNRPQVGLRTATIVIEAEATADSKIKRRLDETVRIRNDLRRGDCPAP